VAVCALLTWSLALAALLQPLRTGTSLPVRAAPWPSGTAVPRFGHVFVVVMENRTAPGVYGPGATPYLRALAARYSVATDYLAVRHPSLPNYLALLGGGTFGVASDCAACYVSAQNLVDQLEAAHVSWGAYMEGLPRPGFLAGSWWPGLYAAKHDPFVYFRDIRASRARRDRIRPLRDLWPALAGGSVPRFAWITPDLCHDMHTCPSLAGDDWLRLVLPRILASRAWRDGGVLFLTWDEGGSGSKPAGGRVALIAISPMSVPHGRDPRPAGHYALLHTIEAAFGVGCLGHACRAPVLTGLFRRPTA